MTSALLSRLLPPAEGSPSIYETIREHDEDSDGSDLEERAAMSNGSVIPQDRFQDLQLDSQHASRTDMPPASPLLASKRRIGRGSRLTRRPKWLANATQIDEAEEAEDDVPASLLIEDARRPSSRRHENISTTRELPANPIPVVGPSNARTERQWQKTREQQTLHSSSPPTQTHNRSNLARTNNPLIFADRKQRAMWRWSNVQNLDHFLAQVYDYYVGNGFWAIVLLRCFTLTTWAFVLGFSIFLTQCVDYGKLRGSTRMSEILISQCTRKMGAFPNILLWMVCLLWLVKLFQYTVRIRTLLHLHDFYYHLLDISESDIQSATWQDIVSRLMALRDANPHTTQVKNERTSKRFLGTQNKQRMDAHDIANRLMRRENYLIAMFNKDIFDMTLPIPFLGNRQFFSRTLEWNIYQTIFDFVFNQHGQIRPFFLKDTHRKQLVESLRRRFMFAGFFSLLVAPILVFYNLIQFFFENFNEYQKNPAQVGSRMYSPYAEWKFREFNELYHIFQRRMNMSYPFASRYVNQFPKAKTVLIARFVTLVSGALISVLVIASALDPDLFFGFEITKDRTVLFYIGVFGSIWAVARGLLPEENTVHDTAYTMSEVVQFTHYSPPHWQDRLSSDEVRRDFVQLYKLKLVIFLEEVFSMFITPFILWYSLPRCSDRIIDFFREFTVHVDGIGYVCSFAEFNFQKKGSLPSNDPVPHSASGQQTLPNGGLRDDFYSTKDQKLEASYWGFMNDYARNPKTDIRFPYQAHLHSQRQQRQSRFHPPPVMPGLLTSPELQSTDLLHQVSEHATTATSNVAAGRATSILDKIIASPRRGGVGFQSGTPRFAAQSHDRGSPLQSMLLDPHHQPPSSVGGGSPAMVRPQTRGGTGMKKSRHTNIATESIIEQPLDEERGEPQKQDKDVHPSVEPPLRGTVEDSGGELGSWKMDHDETTEDEENDDDALEAVLGGARVGTGATGVLGMLKQFQRAREGRTGIAGGGIPGAGGVPGGIGGVI